jgi:predicted PurR-regulated permease PerM
MKTVNKTKLAAKREDEQIQSVDSDARMGVRLLTLAALTAALITLSVLLSLPFLPAITWAVALAIMSWPMHQWVRKRIGWPKLSAALSTIVVILVIVVPIVLVSYQMTREVAEAADRARVNTDADMLRSKIEAVPGVSFVTDWMDRVGINLEEEVGKVAMSFVQGIGGFARGSLAAVFQFLIMTLLLYFIFVDRAEFLQGLRGMLPLSRAESESVFHRAAESVHANLYASVTTSLIDAAGGTLMFWLLGLPSPFLWGFVMFVLCLLPILGATMVWIPAAAILLFSDRWPQAFALAAWGVTTSIVVDYLLYAKLVGKRMRMHDAPVLIAFLGGLALFGISGMVLGPVIFAVTIAFLDVWKARFSDDPEASSAHS